MAKAKAAEKTNTIQSEMTLKREGKTAAHYQNEEGKVKDIYMPIPAFEELGKATEIFVTISARK